MLLFLGPVIKKVCLEWNMIYLIDYFRLGSSSYLLNAFLYKRVKFLGHEVSEEGINTDPNTVKAVKDWPRTKTPLRK
jgi:hypothetical protein